MSLKSLQRVYIALYIGNPGEPVYVVLENNNQVAQNGDEEEKGEKMTSAKGMWYHLC